MIQLQPHLNIIADCALPWLSSLKTLRERYKAKNPFKIFPEPYRYGEPDRGGVSIVVLSPSKPRPLPPAWWQLKARFPAEWLWEACNKVLESREDNECGIYGMGEGYSVKDKMAYLEIAIRDLTRYPPRPATTLPSSPSVDQLREVLGRAGRVPETDNGESVPGVDRDEDWEMDVSWSWTKEYEEEVYKALIEVIKELGLGDAGWKSVRWEVYDKVRLAVTLVVHFASD